jgi:LCP family protein required for cell wall assembly
MSNNVLYVDYIDDSDQGPERRRGWRIIGWISIGLSVIMVAVSLVAYAGYLQLQGNIHHEDVTANIGTNRPKKLNSALNILMLGTDSRAGANAKYGAGMKNDPAHSDTMILLHLSPGGGQAMGISFPRDLMVPIPSCRLRTGGTSAAQSVGMINSAFTIGGASCSIKTIEGISNIRIDHFLQVDFTSFKGVVDALGGVEICLPQSVHDKNSGLNLSKGKHLLQGEQALAYVRNRHGLGDGSDLGRIKRQQQFLGSVAKKALSAGTLTDVTKMWKLLNAATKSLTTDKGFDALSMAKVGQGLQGMTAGKVRFVTVPWGAYAPDINRVALRQPAADDFFTAIRNDKTAPNEPAPATTAAAKAPAKIPASHVKVRVFNASGIPGQALRVKDLLTAQGFVVVKVGNGTASMGTTTRVLYASGADQQAATLAALVPGGKTAAGGGGSTGVVDLVLGTDWTGLKGAAKKSTPIPTLQGEIKATDNICKVQAP